MGEEQVEDIQDEDAGVDEDPGRDSEPDVGWSCRPCDAQDARRYPRHAEPEEES